MSKIAKIVIAVVIVAVIGYFGFRDKGENVNAPIKIGVIAPLTGIVADYGEEMKKGVESASIEGIELIFEDDKCEAKEAVTAFQKLVNVDKVSFVIGPACGSPQEAIVPLLKDKEIIALVPAAASKALFAQSGENFYNIQYSLEDESKFMAEYLSEKGLVNVALVRYGNAFSKTHADSFKANFKGKIVIDSTITDDNANMPTELAKIKAAKVDAIYAPDISFFFGGGSAKLKELSITAPVFTTYVAELPAVRALVEGVSYSFPGDLEGTEGAIFNLSKEATELLAPIVKDCEADYNCVKEEIIDSGLFDPSGTMIRPMILKQIKNALPVNVN